jgi:diguanylate cyclase (GGDEF)-like protein
MPRVLAVGLRDDAVELLQRRLENIEIRSVSAGERLTETLATERPSLLIVNHFLGGPAGVDVVNRVRAVVPDVQVVYLLDRRIDSEVGRKLLEQMGLGPPLLTPVAVEEVAQQVSSMLGVWDSAPDTPPVQPGRSAPRSAPAGGVENDEEKHADHPFLLLVDDAAEMRERIVAEASIRGMRAVATPSVVEGRAILARERADAVLLDLGLINSSDDGLTLLEYLDRQSVSVPVLFLAERDSFVERVQAVNLGGRAFLPKSTPPSDILKAVTRLLQQLQATESRVLAVDDDPEVLADLRKLLEPKGIKLTTLDDPLRFWNALEQSVPDLLMVDFDLPRWSGLELCRVVRNDTRWSALPVLCLTASADSDTVQRVFDAGADDFVSKPIIGPELVTKVVNRLQRIQLYRILAEIDPLTGIANRLKATEALDRLLRLAKRQKQVFSLALLDLDNFKQINDRFGHGTGDDALRKLGTLLSRTFRTEDVVARLGGEEFIVGMYGMPRARGVQRLTALLETLRDETPPRLRDDGVLLTYSAGVAQYPDDGTDLTSLLSAADAAQFRAKREGKNQVVAAGTTGGEGTGGVAAGTDVVVVSADETGGAMVRALDEAGLRVQWIKDGETAVLWLAGTEPKIAAHVVLLDLDSGPAGARVDGLSVLRRLNRDGVVGRMRVIVIDGAVPNGGARKALQLGAFKQISRPLNLVALQQVVREAMEVP